MKYYKIIFAGLLIVIFSACSDSFLEENPKSLMSPSNFPATADDCELIMGGIVDILDGQDFYERPLYLLAEAGSDETRVYYTSGDRYELDYMEYTTDNQYIRKVWQSCYQVVNQSNVLIKYLPEEDWAKSYVGAAKFYRAWMYSYIVRLWGSTILATEPTEQLNDDDVVVRAPETDVYNLIVEDLLFAEKNLPLSWTGNAAHPDDGRPTAGAAKILLAKMYATMAGWPVNDASKWALASAKAKEVIDMPEYGLEANFSDLFLIAKQNGKEHIFSIQITEPGGTMMTVASRPKGGGIKKGGWYTWQTTETFMNTFSDDDTRKAGSFMTELVQPPYETIPYTKFKYNKTNDQPGPAIQKWQDYGREKFTDNAKRTALNTPIFRYAEALLIRAEAENEVNGPNAAAYEAFNAVRGRSNPDNLLPDGLSKDDFRTAVRQEWSFELAFELKRRFNLLRWELFDEVMSVEPHASKGYASFKKYYPIPQAEFDAGMDPDLQTPGY